MKKNGLAGIAFLILLAASAVWFNIGIEPENQTDTQTGIINGDFLLAVSWQPAFCEQRPNRPECRSQRVGRFDAKNFSLHGLWPQPRGNSYCGVSASIVSTDKSGRWGSLPKLDLSNDLRQELSVKMPGYRSHLHRHEWFKHGTCINGITPETYFRFSLNLLDQLNASEVRNLLADNSGTQLRFGDVRNAVQRSFGRDAGTRFILDCYRDDGRRIIQELKLSLTGVLSSEAPLSELISAGERMSRSCPAGIVDPVGLQ